MVDIVSGEILISHHKDDAVARKIIDFIREKLQSSLTYIEGLSDN